MTDSEKPWFRWKPVIIQVSIVASVLAIDALVAVLIYPDTVRFHKWATFLGVTVVRAFGKVGPFAEVPITWVEMLANVGLNCAMAAAIAITMQTQRKWRNIVRLQCGIALAVVLIGWLVPHNALRLYGEWGESIVAMGDGTMVFATHEDIDHTAGHSVLPLAEDRNPAPGIAYTKRVGAPARENQRDEAAPFSAGGRERPPVVEHRYVIEMWLLLLPISLFAVCDLWLFAQRRGKTARCGCCGIQFPPSKNPTCPRCHPVVAGRAALGSPDTPVHH